MDESIATHAGLGEEVFGFNVGNFRYVGFSCLEETFGGRSAGLDISDLNLSARNWVERGSVLTGAFGGGLGPIIATRAAPTSGSRANIVV